jgi:bis(5'-nucleosidyl)-tetraphosphatase
MIRKYSAGGIVFKRQKNGQLVWLVGEHSGYHKWVLPKGLIEEGEKSLETALRETEEEMGVRTEPVSEEPVYRVEYFFWGDNEKTSQRERIFKTVKFFLLKYISGSISSHDAEMAQVRWLPFEQALRKLAFKGERDALEKAKEKMIGRSNSNRLF